MDDFMHRGHGGQNFHSFDEHDTTRHGIADYHHGYGDMQDAFADESMGFNSIGELLRLSSMHKLELTASR